MANSKLVDLIELTEANVEDSDWILVYDNSTGTTKKITRRGVAGTATGTYTSTAQTITSSSMLTLQHGLGVKPTKHEVFLICTTADGTWEVGDEMFASLSSSSRENTVSYDATNVYMNFSDQAACFLAAPEGGGALVLLVNSKWDLYVRVLE